MSSWESLPPELRQRIELGNKALEFLKKHDNIDRWRDTGQAANDLQSAAMQLAGTNRPIGKAYNKAWAELAAHVPHLRDLPTSTRTNAMWLATEWEPINRCLMTLGHEQRWRLNHPTAIRRRYDATHKVPGDKAGNSPAAGYKAQLAQAIMERDEARQQLKRVESDGSLFNLEMDTAEQIGRVIGNTVGEKKAEAIAAAIREAAKAKRARRTHAG